MAASNPALERVLDTCVSHIEGDGWEVEDCLAQYPEFRAALEPRLRAVMDLRGARALRVYAAFRRRAQARLKLRLQASQRPPQSKPVTDSVSSRSRWLKRASVRTRSLPKVPTIIALTLGLFVALGGVVSGTNAAGPGEALYGLDLAVEQLRLSLTTDKANEAEHEDEEEERDD